MRMAFASGAAAERFDRMVAALGGPTDFLDDFDAPSAPARRRSPTCTAGRAGFVTAIDTRGLGLAVVELGGGRRRASDAIDHAVGLEALLGLGASVEPDTPLARIHAADEAGAAPPPRRGCAPPTARRRRARRGRPLIHRPDRLMPRAILLVMDSVGCGGAPDAADFGDDGRQHPRPHHRGLRRRPRRRGPLRPAAASRTWPRSASAPRSAPPRPSTCPASPRPRRPSGRRRPRSRAARTRRRATGSSPACRCPGTGTTSRAPTRRSRQRSPGR